MKQFLGNFDFRINQILSLYLSLIDKADEGIELIAEIEIIKCYLVDTFIFEFQNQITLVWDTYNEFILKYYKPDLVIYFLAFTFLLANLAYFILNYFIYRQTRSRVSELACALFELNKKDLEAYLQSVVKFAGFTKKFWQDRRNDNFEDPSMSSEDEKDQILDDRIDKQTAELKKDKASFDPGICDLTRPYKPTKTQKRFQEEKSCQLAFLFFGNSFRDMYFDFGRSGHF